MFFLLLASLCFAGSLFVVTAANSIHSVLFLVLVFFSSASLFLFIKAEFLALIFLVVYVGAIAVLFLFVVMMLNVRQNELEDRQMQYVSIGFLFSIIFLCELFYVFESDFSMFQNVSSLYPFGSSILGSLNHSWFQNIDSIGSIESLGFILYNSFFFAFIVSGCILLVAMIGAIVLTLHRRASVKKQEIFSQVSQRLVDAQRFIS
jgi:NADH-quinone oxidoreductase subunit J